MPGFMTIPQLRRQSAAAACAFVCLFASAWADEPPRRRAVTLLVPGIQFDLAVASHPWGEPVRDERGRREFSGLIGQLRRSGDRFGGVIRCEGSRLQLPRCLDAAHCDGDPRQATLFEMTFSESAAVDGLAYKALELADAIGVLRRLTGCDKVRIVAHSAGGLVARAYLQNALPSVPYAGDVDRLITIATPHLGSALAGRFGGLLGTRATALQPTAELIRRLNEQLPLPTDVLFASVVVRGVGAEMAALDLSSSAYDPYIDPALLRGMPLDFRRGGDQVVDVRSQNLRLSRIASRYETATGRPVQYLLARVADPSPADRSPRDATVHDAATSDPWVMLWVEMLLVDNQAPWMPLVEPHLDRWVALQSKLLAYGLIEQQAAERWPLWEVTQANVAATTLLGKAASTYTVSFHGQAASRRKFLLGAPRTTAVQGVMQFDIDRFGRVRGLVHSLERVADKDRSAAQ